MGPVPGVIFMTAPDRPGPIRDRAMPTSSGVNAPALSVRNWPGRASLCLVARAGGAWLALSDDRGGPAELYAVSPDRPLDLCGLKDPADNRGLAEVFRAMAPQTFLTVEQFAALIAHGEPEPECQPAAEAVPEPEAEPEAEEVAAPRGLMARLLRRG